MKRPATSINLFAILLCLAFLTGCKGAGDPTKPEPTIQNSISPAPSATASPLPEYSTPEGSSSVMRYGQYIYYIPRRDANGSTLYRMHEDGTDPERLLPDEGFSGFFTSNGKLYATSQASVNNESNNRVTILRQIGQDGSMTEVKRYTKGLLRALDGELYFTPIGPLEEMERAEEQERQWESISGAGQGFSAKWPDGQIYQTDGYLYYLYSVADVPGKKYHQVLVRALPDGTKEKTLDQGQFMHSGLARCGDYLVYGKGKQYFPSQIWAYDMENGKKKLLFDMVTLKDAPDTLEIVGMKGNWIYFKYRLKNSGYILCRVSPDDVNTVERIWGGPERKDDLWQVDLSNGWIYYGQFVRVAEEERYMNSNDYHYILRSHRCRLDGSDDILFCDRSAQDPVTIGDWIYFASADKEVKNVTMKRYNTATKVLEELPNGLILDLSEMDRQ